MVISILDDPPTLNVMPDKDGAGVMISVAVAICRETQRLVSVDSRLVPTAYNNEPCWEFSFEIAVMPLDGCEEPFTTQDRDIAKHYLPDDVRPKVMGIVCACCRALVTGVQPEQIYRVTKGRNLGAKALRKHHMLTTVFQECGYEVTQCGTDPANRLFWSMHRMAC